MSDPTSPEGDTHPNAGRASGYTDERGNDIGENLVNRVTELMVGPQTKLIQLATRIDAQTTIQDQRFSYVLTQLGAFLDKEDARHDALKESEATTVAAIANVALTLDQLTGLVQQGIATGGKALAVAERSLAVSQSNATRLERVEKDVVALKEGLETSAAQWDDLQLWKDGVAKRLAGIEQFDRDALLVRIERIDRIIADLPTRRDHDPDAIVDAVIERLGKRSTRGKRQKDDADGE